MNNLNRRNRVEKMKRNEPDRFIAFWMPRSISNSSCRRIWWRCICILNEHAFLFFFYFFHYYYFFNSLIYFLYFHSYMQLDCLHVLSSSFYFNLGRVILYVFLHCFIRIVAGSFVYSNRVSSHNKPHLNQIRTQFESSIMASMQKSGIIWILHWKSNKRSPLGTK